MPLIESPSKAARSENIATEIKAGKDPKQAAAIGYAVQRENKDDIPGMMPEDQPDTSPNFVTVQTIGVCRFTPAPPNW